MMHGKNVSEIVSLGAESLLLLKKYKFCAAKRYPLPMALSSPSLAYLSIVQGYFDFVGLVLASIVGVWVRYHRLGLKRITPVDFPAVRTNGDLSHHLCRETRERKPNAIKNVWRMAQAKGPGKVVTLANGNFFFVLWSPNPDCGSFTPISLSPGDPHVSLYPISRVSFQIATLKGPDPVLEWSNGSGPSKTISNRECPGALPLQTALAYGAGAGISATLEAMTKLITVFHSPRNHLVTLTLGNSDGITKCFRLFGERGDTFLADELSFSALTNAVTSQGVTWAPVKIDDGGLIPEELERILSSWNTKKQGNFPHVLYTVPYDSPVPFHQHILTHRPPQLWTEPHRFDAQPGKEEENLRNCSEI